MDPEHVDVTLPAMVKHAFTLSEGTIQWFEPNRLELRAAVPAEPGDTVELRMVLPDSQRRVLARMTVKSVVPDVDDVLLVATLDEIASDDEIWLERWLRSQLVDGQTAVPRFGSRPRPPARRDPSTGVTAPTTPTSARVPAGREGPAIDPSFVVNDDFAEVVARWHTRDALYRDWFRQLRHRRVEVPWAGEPPPSGRTVRVTLRVPEQVEVVGMGEIVGTTSAHVRIDLTLFPEDRDTLAAAAGLDQRRPPSTPIP